MGCSTNTHCPACSSSGSRLPAPASAPSVGGTRIFSASPGVNSHVPGCGPGFQPASHSLQALPRTPQTFTKRVERPAHIRSGLLPPDHRAQDREAAAASAPHYSQRRLCRLPALASWGLGTPWSGASHLHGGAGVVPVCQHVGLLLETQPLALRGCHAVLGLGGREGEVLPGGRLGGDGVGFGAGRRRLLLRIGGSSI